MTRGYLTIYLTDPRRATRSRSPRSPTLQLLRPPAYLARDLASSDRDPPRIPANRSLSQSHLQPLPQSRSKSRQRSRSQNPSANNRHTPQDFAFVDTLGEG